MNIIIVMIMLCGQPDTIIIQYPDKKTVFTHNVKSEEILLDLYEMLKGKHSLIVYEDDRGICA